MANKTTIIIVFFIMFPVARMAKQRLKPEACPVTDAINKHKDEVKKEQEMVKKLIDEVVQEIEQSCGPTCSDCPAGWLRYGEACYYIDDTPTTKEADARIRCQNMGADLPVIRSAAEDKFILNLMKKQRTLTHLGVWLGMHRSAKDFKLYWVDGTLLEEQYQNWADNEPNNFNNEEHCGNMYGTPGHKNEQSGKWNDLPCEYSSLGNEAAPVILCQKFISDCVPA